MAQQGIPIYFRRTSPKIASYDWVDFTSGAGYKKFYGACAINAGPTKSYFLTTKVIDSATGSGAMGLTTRGIGTWAAGAGGDIDIDFDITFNVPAYVATATAMLNYTFWNDGTASTTATINVYHVSTGAVETSIGTITGATQTTDDAYYRECFKIALTGKTFGVGEKLRLNVILTNLAATGIIIIYHDPSSQITVAEAGALRTIGTDLVFDVPFRIV